MFTLLSIFVGTAFAESVTFNFSDVETVKTYGNANPPTAASQNSPFVNFTSQGITFAASGEGDAKYVTSNKNVLSLRLYSKAALTISAEGTITSISFDIQDKSKQTLTPSTGTYTFSSGSWTGSSKSVTFTSSSSNPIFKITVNYIKSGEKQMVRIYKKATAVESGKKYLMVVNDNDQYKSSQKITSSYGYISTADTKDINGTVKEMTADNELTFTTSGNGYTITQSDNRQLYMKGTYDSFNLDASPSAGNIFNVAANTDGSFKITNAAMSKWIQYDSSHKNFGAYNETKGTMPYLYVFDHEEEYTAEISIKGEAKFYGSTTVTIVPSAEGNHIYYTLDGVAPDESDNPLTYTEPFTLDKSAKVMAWEEETDLRAEMDFEKLEYQTVNIAGFKKLEKKTPARLDLTGSKVLYTWKSNNNNVMAFVKDADDNALELYYSSEKLDLNLEAGNVLTGTIVMAFDIYNNIPEAIVTEDTNADDIMATGSETITPVECTIADAQDRICDLVIIKGLSPKKEAYTKNVTKDGTTITITLYNYFGYEDESTNIALYNQFHIPAYEDEVDENGNVTGGFMYNLDEDKKYDVTGISATGKINSKLVNEIFITNVKESSETGINDIKADNTKKNNRFYNLSGQEVNKSYKGVVISNGKKFFNIK